MTGGEIWMGRNDVWVTGNKVRKKQVTSQGTRTVLVVSNTLTLVLTSQTDRTVLVLDTLSDPSFMAACVCLSVAASRGPLILPHVLSLPLTPYLSHHVPHCSYLFWCSSPSLWSALHSNPRWADRSFARWPLQLRSLRFPITNRRVLTCASVGPVPVSLIRSLRQLTTE